MAGTYFLTLLYELLGFVILFYVFGLILWLIEIIISKLLGEKSYRFYCITGLLGTSIHEASHALFCLIFCHKIEEIKLFEPNEEEGTLGYVCDSYNHRNPYAIIGNYFIGIAPILVGGGIIVLLLFLLLHSTYDNIINLAINTKTTGDYFLNFFKTFVYFFSKENFTSWQFYVFLLIMIPIALHMNASIVDLKHSLTGIPIIIVIFLIMNCIMLPIGMEAFNNVIEFFKKMIYIESTILSISIILNLISMLFCGIGRIIATIIKK